MFVELFEIEDHLVVVSFFGLRNTLLMNWPGSWEVGVMAFFWSISSICCCAAIISWAKKFSSLEWEGPEISKWMSILQPQTMLMMLGSDVYLNHWEKKLFKTATNWYVRGRNTYKAGWKIIAQVQFCLCCFCWSLASWFCCFWFVGLKGAPAPTHVALVEPVTATGMVVLTMGQVA